MGLLVRVMVALGLIAGLLYAGLLALGNLVEPEPREIVVPVPMPKPPSGNPGG